MLAKLTSKNQITLPKAIISAFEGATYFDVTEENGCIVLAPVRVTPARPVSLADAEALIEKMKQLQVPMDTTDPEVWVQRHGPGQRRRRTRPHGPSGHHRTGHR